MSDVRSPDHPIERFFLDRWSPRSFSGEPVPHAVLASAFEAARWAPSAWNAQPWRFVVARPRDAAWETFLALLIPHNRLWASRASALVVIVSKLTVERAGQLADNHSHSFDTGAAWANFAHQALLLGWHTHGIGGFDRAAARTELAIPDGFAAEAMVAVGRQGHLADLDEQFHAREKPSGRNPQAAFVFSGCFGSSLVPEPKRNVP
jgi:nitroreductase